MEAFGNNITNWPETCRAWARGKTIALLGGSGNIGLTMIGKLLTLNIKSIVVLDKSLPADSPSWPTGVSFKVCDLLEEHELDLGGVDAVFHLAGMKNAHLGMQNPSLYYRLNGSSCLTILEACRRYGVSQFIYLSSAHVYGRASQVPVDESVSICPLSIYGGSKGVGEQIIHSYASSFGINALIARLCNVYSRHLTPDTIIGKALVQAFEKNAIGLWNYQTVRDFIYIDDAAEGLIRLAAASHGQPFPDIYNLSSGEAHSTGVIAEMIRQLFAQILERQIEVLPPEQPGSGDSLQLSIAKLKAKTGWTPTITLAAGLKDIISMAKKRGSHA